MHRYRRWQNFALIFDCDSLCRNIKTLRFFVLAIKLHSLSPGGSIEAIRWWSLSSWQRFWRVGWTYVHGLWKENSGAVPKFENDFGRRRRRHKPIVFNDLRISIELAKITGATLKKYEKITSVNFTSFEFDWWRGYDFIQSDQINLRAASESKTLGARQIRIIWKVLDWDQETRNRAASTSRWEGSLEDHMLLRSSTE